jgi:putative transposase
LVPGAGPTIEGGGWKVVRHPKHRRRRKPYLTDNVELGRAFRKHCARGLKRLLHQGKLKIGGSVEFLNDLDQRDDWLDQLEAIDWNVFIEGPPNGKSDPANVVKYLAGYLTGGPISDQRIIRADDDEVRFWARPKKSMSSSGRRRGMNKSEPYRLSGLQFMRR